MEKSTNGLCGCMSGFFLQEFVFCLINETLPHTDRTFSSRLLGKTVKN